MRVRTCQCLKTDSFATNVLKYFSQNKDSLGKELCKFSFVSFIQEAFVENFLCQAVGRVGDSSGKLAPSLT